MFFYDSKHVSDMVAPKFPEREFKGLLNFVRERIKHVCFKKNQLLFKLLKTQLRRILPS